MMICEPWDVVVTAFPITDLPVAKGRPALVLSTDSFQSSTGHAVVAMVTSARHSRWATDVEITDAASAGLRAPSIVRLKLVTLVGSRISKRIGHLSQVDRAAVARQLRASLVPLTSGR
jgi:mRNA interferase MazF